MRVSALLCLLFIHLGLAVLRAETLLVKQASRPLQAESTLDSLVPWETPISGFFIRSHHGVPTVDPDAWHLVIDGLVEKPLHLSLSEIKALPSKTLHAVLECSGNGRSEHRPKASGIQWGNGALGNAEWTGVSLSQLLDRAKPLAKAKFATVSGADLSALPTVPAFRRSLPLQKLQDPTTLIAWLMNREPMPILHGGPLRLVLPGWYGQNWIKWVTHIQLSDQEDDGFYMKKGYRYPKKNLKPGEKWNPATGVPITALRVQSFFTFPRNGEFLSPGTIEIKGKCFSGTGTIQKVEISSDSGKTWKEANVEAPRPTGGWQEFSLPLTLPKAGKVSLWSRATDASGNQQPLKLDWNPSGYLANRVGTVAFTIDKTPGADGETLARAKCLTCHSDEMIRSQDLDRSAWEKVIPKMKAFGADLTLNEEKRLLDFLSSGKTLSQRTSFALETGEAYEKDEIPGKSESGATLFAVHCAACHGKQGEGSIGPGIKGRAIPIGTFWLTVKEGKRQMPPFGTALSDNQIADLRTYLQGR